MIHLSHTPTWRTLSRNKLVLAVVIIAFLALQWSFAHIHLAEHHSHGEEHHQHDSVAHQHERGHHHGDSIDVSHADKHDNVVELSHDCPTKGSKNSNDKPSHAAITKTPYPALHLTRAPPSVAPSASLSNWLRYSTIRLRAPPISSLS